MPGDKSHPVVSSSVSPYHQISFLGICFGPGAVMGKTLKREAFAITTDSTASLRNQAEYRVFNTTQKSVLASRSSPFFLHLNGERTIWNIRVVVPYLIQGRGFFPRPDRLRRGYPADLQFIHTFYDRPQFVVLQNAKLFLRSP